MTTLESLEAARRRSEDRRRFREHLRSRMAAESYALDAAIASGDLRAAEQRAASLAALRIVEERAPEIAVDPAAVAAVGVAAFERVRPIFRHQTATTTEHEALARLRRLIDTARTASPSEPESYLAAIEAMTAAYDGFVAQFGLAPDPDPRAGGRLVRAGAQPT